VPVVVELANDDAVKTCVSIDDGGVNILASLSFIDEKILLLSFALLGVNTLLSSSCNNRTVCFRSSNSGNID